VRGVLVLDVAGRAVCDMYEVVKGEHWVHQIDISGFVHELGRIGPYLTTCLNVVLYILRGVVRCMSCAVAMMICLLVAWSSLW
jgi:hypothetical protein